MYWCYEDLQMYYETVGDGVPVLMLHGYYVDHHIMTGCLEPVLEQEECRGYKRIYLDLPGMGKTKSVFWIKNADTLSEVLVRFVHEVIGAQPFILAGESYGGYLARGIIKACSAQICGSLFICPCIIPDYEKRDLPKFQVMEREDMQEYAPEKDYNDYAESMVVQTPKTWQRYETEVMAGVNVADSMFLQEYQRNGYAFSCDVDQVEETYHFPTVFFAGRQDDCVGFKDACGILRNYENSSFLVLNAAGHNLQIDQEEIFQDYAKRFFIKIKSSVCK